MPTTGSVSGYPLPMKLVAKAIALVLVVSLLSGCSNAEAEACAMTKIDVAEFNRLAREHIETMFSGESAAFLQQDILTAQYVEQWGGGNFAKANLVVINNPQCYSNEELADAQLSYDQLIKVKDQFDARVAEANAAVGIQ